MPGIIYKTLGDGPQWVDPNAWAVLSDALERHGKPEPRLREILQDPPGSTGARLDLIGYALTGSGVMWRPFHVIDTDGAVLVVSEGGFMMPPAVARVSARR